MKKSLFCLIILSVVSFTTFLGCSSDNPNSSNVVEKNVSPSGNNVAARATYPQSVADEFLKSCESSGSKPEFCACVFEKIQQQYTFEEFSVIESKLIVGQPPADFVEFSGKARAACTK